MTNESLMMENQNTEWKAIWKDEYLAWICGFANSCGGSLYIGVDDDGKPVGVQNPERLCEDIAHAFYLAGYIESWGRGVEKMFAYCREYGCPMPEYTVRPRDIMIKILPVEDTVNDTANGTINIEKQPINGENGTINGENGTINGENGTINLTGDENIILNLLLQDGGSNYAILVAKTNFGRGKVYRLIKDLKEKKVIERVGSKKTGYWKIMKG